MRPQKLPFFDENQTKSINYRKKNLQKKRNFTKLLAALALLAFFMPAMTAVGQTETTYTFSAKDWKASPSNWTSIKAGNQYTNLQGIQVTTGASGACGNSDVSFSNVSKITVKYCTNKASGKGSISWYNVSSTSANAQSGTLVGSQTITAPSSGGTTLKTFEIVPSSPQTGYVQLYVTCTTNSIYVYSVTITTDAGDSSYTVTAEKEAGIFTAYVAEGTTFSGTDTSVTVAEGGSATFQATVISGYIFDGWYNGNTLFPTARPTQLTTLLRSSH